MAGETAVEPFIRPADLGKFWGEGWVGEGKGKSIDSSTGQNVGLLLEEKKKPRMSC